MKALRENSLGKSDATNLGEEVARDFDHADPSIRDGASLLFCGMVRCGLDIVPHLPQVLRAIRPDRAGVRYYLAQALLEAAEQRQDVGEAVSHLEACLFDEDCDNILERMVGALAAVQTHRRAWDRLESYVTHPLPNVRYWTCETLRPKDSRLDPSVAPHLLRLLVKATLDDVEFIRTAAAEFLAEWKRVAPDLTETPTGEQ
ncbi:MAG: hypothetical protein HYY17_08505 [Planctomycetes bacterium]|nr:hypothetical protein [Planctomycetota bacterium]